MVSSSSTVFVLFLGSVPFSPRSVEETNVCRTELRTVCEFLPRREDLVGDDDDDDGDADDDDVDDGDDDDDDDCALLPRKEDLVGHTKKLGLHVHLGYELSSRDLNQMDLFYCVGKKTTRPLKTVQISSLSSDCLFTLNAINIHLIDRK